jgi:hypothetical protein
MLKALDHLEEWLIAFLLFVNIILLLASNVNGAVIDRADHGADPVSRGTSASIPFTSASSWW